MRHPRTYMARSRVTWLLWMFMLTPLWFVLSVLQIAWDAGCHAYRMWHWQYRYEWKDWFGHFSEKHRTRMASLAARPVATGTYIAGPEARQ